MTNEPSLVDVKKLALYFYTNLSFFSFILVWFRHDGLCPEYPGNAPAPGIAVAIASCLFELWGHADCQGIVIIEAAHL